jgi:hypothetical protein
MKFRVCRISVYRGGDCRLVSLDVTSCSLVNIYYISGLICYHLAYSFSQYQDTWNKGFLSYEVFVKLLHINKAEPEVKALLTDFTISKLMVNLGTFRLNNQISTTCPQVALINFVWIEQTGIISLHNIGC